MKHHLQILRHDKPQGRPLTNIPVDAFEAETGVKTHADDFLVLLEDDVAGYCEDTVFLVRKSGLEKLPGGSMVVYVKHDEALPAKLKDVDRESVIGCIVWSGTLE